MVMTKTKVFTGDSLRARGTQRERIEVPRSAKARIACVTEDEDFLKSVRVFLKTAPYNVAAARSGVLGLHLFQAWQPDIVILDFHLSGISGAEVAGKMKRLAPAVPIILVSEGQAVREDARLFIDASVDKNGWMSELVPTIEPLLVLAAGKDPAWPGSGDRQEIGQVSPQSR